MKFCGYEIYQKQSISVTYGYNCNSCSIGVLKVKKLDAVQLHETNHFCHILFSAQTTTICIHVQT